MTVIIPLTRGQQTVISDEDADLADFKWCAQFHPGYAGGGQHLAIRTVGSGKKQKRIYLHRVILSRILGRELDSSELTDHIDRKPLNNRRENLRLANHSQNGANQTAHKNSHTGLKGVYFDKRARKYRAQIGIGKKKTYLGLYPTPQEAHEAYKQAAREFFGEFANFGDSK